MRRAAVVLAVVTAGFVAAALPAQAKAPGDEAGVQAESVAVTGPGTGSGISLNGEDAAFWGLASRTFGHGKLANRPTGPLGPAYQVLYTLECGDGTMAVLHQTLYPFHALGAWVFTAAGQTGCGFLQPVAGWSGAQRPLVKLLESKGLPAVAPKVPALPPVHVPAPDPWPVALLLTAVVALLALAVVAGRPRRRVPVVARA